MKVELNQDAIDGLMHSILIQDYKSLCADISRLENLDDISPYQEKDLAHNYEYQAAMEKMMEYYIGFNWMDQL